MTALTIRGDRTPAVLRKLAKAETNTRVARRLLAIAIALGLEYGGWCPKGGWAEDHVIPPGVLALYPKLTATPSFTVRFSIEAID